MIATPIQSNQAFSAGGGSSTFATLSFSNANGVSFSNNAGQVQATVATNYQSQGAYLTTAMLSNAGSDFVGLNSALTANGVSASINSSGISLNFPAFLTTAALSNHSHNLATTTTNGALIVVATTNSVGATFAVPPFLTTAQPVGDYLTTAMLSNQSSLFAGVGETVGTTAGTDLVMTVDTAGVSIGYPRWITTQSGQAFSADASSTFQTLIFQDSNGISFSNNAGALRITHGLQFTSATSAITSAAMAATSRPAFSADASSTFQTLSFQDSNGISFSNNAGAVRLTHGLQFTSATSAITANAQNTSVSSRFGQSWELEGNNTAGTTVSAQGSVWYFSGGNNMTLSGNSNTIIFSAGAGGAAGTLTNFYEPFYMLDGTATYSQSLSQLNVQPFTLDDNISFGQIQMLAIGTLPATSFSNSLSGRLTNSTQRFLYSNHYTVGNTEFYDLFLFQRGTGKFTTAIQTFASTRNSFATNYQFTNWGDATLTNASGGSLRGSQTVSITVSYPFMTSAQSIDGASTHTTWQSGYTTWTSAANNSSSFTYSTSAARTLSIGSTFPATVGWSGAKMVNFNFATSLTAGAYWLGMLRHSSSSGASATNHSFTGAAGTGNSFSTSYNSTAVAVTQTLQFIGKTNTIVNSIGFLGFITTNNLAPNVGLGSFSGTWASNTTYLNNAANPAGAIAYSQIRTQSSFFQTWFQMGSNRMG